MNIILKSVSLLLGLSLASMLFTPQAQAGVATKLFWHTPVKLGATLGTFIIFLNASAYVCKEPTKEKPSRKALMKMSMKMTLLAFSMGAASIICLKSWLNAMTAKDEDEEQEDEVYYEYSNY